MNKRTLIIAIIALFLDQITKVLASSFLSLSKSIKLIKNFFYLTLCHNTGAAWGILNKYPIILILLSFIAIVIIYHFMFSYKNNLRNNLAFGLLLGGLVGNLIDRIIFGYVVDFIDFIIFKYDYPVFNVADICIVIGVFLIIISTIKGDDKNESNSNRRGRKIRQVSSK